MDRELRPLGREVTAPEPGDPSLVWAFFALTPLEFSQGQLFHFAVLQGRRGGSTEQISPSKGKSGSKRRGGR